MISGTLFIISAPSGAGKTSLLKALSESLDGLHIAISHTTRPPRPGEHDGISYYFIDRAEFDAMVSTDAFLEYANVFDYAYGTARSTVEGLMVQGGDVILEIDWQGARQVREHFSGCQSIFILPPSREALEARLRSRGQDSDDVIKRRMADALNEMGHFDEADYIIINDVFDDALRDLRSIFVAQRLRIQSQRERQHALLRNLLASGTQLD